MRPAATPWASPAYRRQSRSAISSPLFVVGAAALYLATNPGATPAQVKTALIENREPGPIPDDPDGIDAGLLKVAGF